MSRRFIDADKLWNDRPQPPRGQSQEYDKGFWDCIFRFSSLIKKHIDNTTVDVVEVVRCKDCAKEGLATCPICFIEKQTLQFINHDPDFFCGYGERREE